ncbi:hypothetical protein EEW87_011525 [Janibacter melonis]|uniref:ACT domain-containing protein n=1 Tax=Janibacter melonis TaxID=262209 RepID=A0A5P8FP36_9MICO|nr:ACT domain-containing protein [Janibacter melonis]QFQ30800.1 hypothetical protein EEW87_011525 [Janibacter melonis]
MTDLVLTVTADDRAGLVSRLAQVVADRGGSWTTSSMAHLAGTFAGVVLVSVPAEGVAPLRSALEGLAADGITVVVRETQPQPATAGEPTLLHLVGQDRPGIVAQVSAAIASAGVGIEEMQTATSEAPMAGGLLFEVRARLVVPEGAGVPLRERLEAIADELMVDLDLADPVTT